MNLGEPGRRLGVIVGITVATALLGAVVFGVLHFTTRPAMTSTILNIQSLKSDMTAARTSSNFQLYAPGSLPVGYSYATNSLHVDSSLVSYSVNYNGGNIVVSQQPRPTTMEQVVKTKQFMTANGPAYLADLNGHTTGFLLTDHTLVILSSSDKPDSDSLQQILINQQTAP